jgi:hypothetical protein
MFVHYLLDGPAAVYPAARRRIARTYRSVTQCWTIRPTGPDTRARNVPGRVKARTVNRTWPSLPQESHQQPGGQFIG